MDQQHLGNFKIYFLPVAGALLMSLADNPLTLVVDGTVVGRVCVALYAGVVYRKKVLPIAWTVVAQEKGHLPESVHIDLMTKVQALVPEGAKVILLGDGEFDGINLRAVINHWQWSYVCRTAKNTKLYWEREPFRFDDMIPAARGEKMCSPRESCSPAKSTDLSMPSPGGETTARNPSIW